MLSPSSIQSLALQGGPANPEEVRALEENPFFAGAVLLRRWDDTAKVPGLNVPSFEHYRSLINSLVM
jgi:predicted HD phosphohydrolase